MSLEFFTVFSTLSWRRPLAYRNQSIDLLSKSMDWFLYDNGFRHKRVKTALLSVYWPIYLEQSSLVYICPKYQILTNIPDTCRNLPSSLSGNAETLYSNASHSVLPVISITSALFPNGKTPLTSSSDIGSKNLDRNHSLFLACRSTRTYITTEKRPTEIMKMTVFRLATC